MLRQPLTFEHVYAADWNTTHHGSRNRNEFPVPAYGSAEEDLHNRGPLIDAINSSRGDKLFGEIPGIATARYNLMDTLVFFQPV